MTALAELIAQTSLDPEVLATVLPGTGALGVFVWLLVHLTRRADGLNRENISELRSLLVHYRERTEDAEALVARYRSLYGPLDGNPANRNAGG